MIIKVIKWMQRIKVIDWMARIMAVVLAIATSHFLIGLMMDPNDYGWWRWSRVKTGIMMMVPLQLGLFLAPLARQKSIIWRLGCTILMFPGFVVLCIPIMVGGKENIVATIPYIIGMMVYLIQYYLLLKNILFKPIHISNIIKDMKMRIKVINWSSIIKVIDWMTRIIAVVLVIETSDFLIGCAFIMDPHECGWWTVITVIMMMVPLQLGLFLAPLLRQKAIIWRLGCAILMFPGYVGIYMVLFIMMVMEFIIVGSIPYIIGMMVYFIQYYLLLTTPIPIYNSSDINKKDIKDILFKPIYISNIIKGIRSKILQI